ncbi:hypothetical protein AX769_17595 [Frondihabitans sp. PAMC 28766]|uniref:ROK family protein n=1 Tax=Frondihabitans sp. PAMC 28766 TaxID=1795630 RepID=UPI00078B99B8|nr:ROK family protein [Frondihabitans sp. PAMC 28766]AMM21621.1 hypothetical protein AX769_17595 [Frondihabitans sp. PAMC 28766]
MSAVLGIDVGGTSVKSRVVSGDVIRWERRDPTPQQDADGCALGQLVAEIASEAARSCGEIEAIGLVVPGIVDDARGEAVLSVNIGWHDLPLRDIVRDHLAKAGSPLAIAFGQDVRAGALAESRSGAAAGLTGTTAFVPVGTGLASALVVDGILVSGQEWPGEDGQVLIEVGPHAGSRVEEIASASAVARRVGAPNAQAAAELVRTGDARAAAVWGECIEVLADAVASIVRRSGCTTVVLGGGLAESGPLLFEPLTEALRIRLSGGSSPKLLPALHRDGAAAAGAVLLAQDLLEHIDR